ncbi:hypothetical protein Cni_G07133 [Canna indica]|uniref:Uncharacterized protein n=1 Tax=Canna indica TaxID=4628 RepID=A0AAQ3JYK3_9LILI|nr:hypothetical protein Cni_G07133 [Canna indica]
MRPLFAVAKSSLITLFYPPLSSSSAQRHRSEVSPTDDGDDKDLQLGFKVWLGHRFDEFTNKLFEITIPELFDDGHREATAMEH